MDRASPLYTWFAQSAQIIGAEKPVGKPEQGLYRLHEAMQEHFAHVLRAVLKKAYDIDTGPERPVVDVRPAQPYNGNLFVDILPLDGVHERLDPFVHDLNRLKEQYAIDAGVDPRRGLVLRFMAGDMKTALDVLVDHYDIKSDTQIARHMYALYHLIDRSGGTVGHYTPANELH